MIKDSRSRRPPRPFPRRYRPHPNAVAAIKRTDPVTVIQPAPIKHTIKSPRDMTIPITLSNDPLPTVLARPYSVCKHDGRISTQDLINFGHL